MSTTPDLPPPSRPYADVPLYSPDEVLAIISLTIEAGKTQEALREALGEIAELKHQLQREQIGNANFRLDLHRLINWEKPICDWDELKEVTEIWDSIGAERDAALARAEKAEARAGSVPAAWIATHESGRVLHLGKSDGWTVDVALTEPRHADWQHPIGLEPSAPSTPPDEAQGVQQ